MTTDISYPEAQSALPMGLDAATRVADALRAQIISGQLPPGQALRESSLSSEFSVARNTLREALRKLTAEGLISQQLYKGATVKRIELTDIRDIYRAREALELRAIEVSSLASQVQMEALHDAVVEEENASNLQTWRDVGTASLHFHQAIVAMLGSRKVDKFFSEIAAQMRLAFWEIADEASFQSPWVSRDRHICDCIRTGRRDEATRAMQSYLNMSEQSIADALRRKSIGAFAPPVGSRRKLAPRVARAAR